MIYSYRAFLQHVASSQCRLLYTFASIAEWRRRWVGGWVSEWVVAGLVWDDGNQLNALLWWCWPLRHDVNDWLARHIRLCVCVCVCVCDCVCLPSLLVCCLSTVYPLLSVASRLRHSLAVQLVTEVAVDIWLSSEHAGWNLARMPNRLCFHWRLEQVRVTPNISIRFGNKHYCRELPPSSQQSEHASCCQPAGA